MADGLIGPSLPVMPHVDLENETEQEPATTHPPQVAERSVLDLPWKQWIVM